MDTFAQIGIFRLNLNIVYIKVNLDNFGEVDRYVYNKYTQFSSVQFSSGIILSSSKKHIEILGVICS